ncbi:hypothetical protein SGO26_21125 [Cupriavidus metallidurans]|uniref:hypothetical protein n=1 Tax=Cupriavidus TaxID=106589 RepID=UPI000E9A3DA4|nr:MULTISPECIES: hypothetical protein [unclassified Cupriavidus]GMG93392.1 hypothetical protein Cmtc_46120 [Cupriavidus sp. TKC]HBD39118.1 hypothetical protein [Cupriavidus sp.]HBO82805.1 hypothetical protein [Cupriavidus sp.]
MIDAIRTITRARTRGCLAALLLCATLAACGGDGDGSTGNSGTTPPTGTTPGGDTPDSAKPLMKCAP